MHNPRLVNILLRLSVASVFFYAGLASLLDPYSWMGYLPPVLRSMFPENLLLMFFSVYELALAVWVLSGWKTFVSASLAALTLLIIISVNYAQMDILFRDLAIFFAAGALIAGSYSNTKTS